MHPLCAPRERRGGHGLPVDAGRAPAPSRRTCRGRRQPVSVPKLRQRGPIAGRATRPEGLFRSRDARFFSAQPRRFGPQIICRRCGCSSRDSACKVFCIRGRESRTPVLISRLHPGAEAIALSRPIILEILQIFARCLTRPWHQNIKIQLSLQRSVRERQDATLRTPRPCDLLASVAAVNIAIPGRIRQAAILVGNDSGL